MANENINLFNDKLAEIRKTHDEKHEEIVNTQKEHITNLITQVLNEAHSKVNGLSSSSCYVGITFYEDDFNQEIQPETQKFLEELGFKRNPCKFRDTFTWHKVFEW